jgi:hypothetical protein
MSLALYPSRVRSNELLERTCLRSPMLIQSLASELSGVSPASVTPDRRALSEADVQDASAALAAQHRLP